jgi:hypothetical protein
MPADNVVRHLSDRDIQVTDDAVATTSASYVHSEAGPKLVWINEYRKVASAPAQVRWQAQILPAVCRFLELPDGWDSYGGRALKLETGIFALKILNDIMGVQTPIPHLIPITTGGIQFEWHENDFDLEVTVSAPYDCELWYQDYRTGASESIALSADLSPLTKQMARLTHSG